MVMPTLVRRVMWAHTGTGEAGGNTFKLPVPASLSGNCLIFWMQYPSGATLSSITDNIGNTWSTTPIKSVTDSGNSMTMAVFAIFGATAGVNLLTITFSASIQGFKPAYMEWCNVATSSASDATPTGQVATAVPITSGSLTTATAGDLVLHFVSCTDNGSNNESGNFDGITKFTAASSFAFVPGQVDLNDGFACEYEIQSSAGAVNPGMGCTLTAGAFSFPSITIALKSASAGTPQGAGIQVVGVHWLFLGLSGVAGNTAYPWQFPTSGNCQVMVISDQIGSRNLISVSGVSSGAWATPLTNTSGDAQGTYKTSSTPSTNELLTITVNDVGLQGSIFGMILDIANAGAFDTFAVTNGTTNYGPGNTSPVAPITPGASSGIVVSVMGNETGPSDAVVTPTGAIFTCPVYTGQGDFSGLTNGDNYGYFNYSSNATQNWVYHDTAASTGFDALEISIAAQSTAADAVAHILDLPGLKLGTPISRLRAPLAYTPPPPNPTFGYPVELPIIHIGLSLGTPWSKLRAPPADSQFLYPPVQDDSTSPPIPKIGMGLGTPWSKLRFPYDGSFGLQTFVYTPTGGLIFGGTGSPLRYEDYTPSGGLKFGGAATISFVSNDGVRTGGLIFGGSGNMLGYINSQGELTYPGMPTLRLGTPLSRIRGISGDISSTQSFAYTPSGGIIFGGTGAPLRYEDYFPSGGLIFGGSGPVSFVSNDGARSGGLILGGSSPDLRLINYIPQGGLVLGGTGSPSYVVNEGIRNGGLVFGGSAGYSTHVSTLTWVASGGMLLGGSAPVSFFHAGGGSLFQRVRKWSSIHDLGQS